MLSADLRRNPLYSAGYTTSMLKVVGSETGSFPVTWICPSRFSILILPSLQFYFISFYFFFFLAQPQWIWSFPTVRSGCPLQLVIQHLAGRPVAKTPSHTNHGRQRHCLLTWRFCRCVRLSVYLYVDFFGVPLSASGWD